MKNKKIRRQLDEGGNFFQTEEIDEEGNTKRSFGRYLDEGKTIYQEEN